MSKGKVVPMPADAPKKGETYIHYKGDSYRVVDMALDTALQEWVVIYEPLYDFPIKLFTRPLNEWRQVVEWEGKQVERFTKI